MENVIVDHLSRLTITHNTHNPPINDEFPEESLLLVEKTPWYAHITNYLATVELPEYWKAQDKKFFFEKIHSYYWEKPFLYKYCADQIIKEYSTTTMRMHVEAISPPRKLLGRCCSLGFIDPLFPRMPIPCAGNATNAKGWGKFIAVT